MPSNICLPEASINSSLATLPTAFHEPPQTINLIHKEHPLPITSPYQNPNLVRKLPEPLIFCLRSERLHQVPWRRCHAILLNLPQVDLVKHRRRDHGRGLSGFGGVAGRCGGLRSVAPHLGVGVRGQVADYLLGGYAGLNGTLNGRFGHLGGDEVWMAGAEVGEESEKGGLKWGGGVGVNAVVGFDYDEALGL